MSSQSKLILRVTILAILTGHFLTKTFVDQILPHGTPVELLERPTSLPIDFDSTLLTFQHGRTQRIYERLEQGEAPKLKGPETVVVNPRTGDLFVMSSDAQLLLLDDIQQDKEDMTRATARTTRLHSLGVGRPLGGSFTPDGKTLYIADAVLGLMRIHNPTDPKSKVELLVDSVVQQGMNGTKEYSRILYANDICIGPKTGLVYFTDASDIASDRVGYRSQAHWDTLYASKVDLVRGKPAGRVLEYNPATDTTRVLADGLKFANGIAVDKDENFLVFAQTFGPRITKLYLRGEKAGVQETLLEPDHLTGYPDGVDCAWEGGRKCYAVMPSSYLPIHTLLNRCPDPFDRILRVVLLLLPRWLAPKVKKYGGIVEFDPEHNHVKYIQDPTGKDIAMLTGVTYYNGKLYLGSLQNQYIGVYSLAK